MPRNLFGFVADQIVDRPWLTFLFLVVVTAFCFVGHYDPQLIFPPPAPVQEIADEGDEEPGDGAPKKQIRPPANVQPVRVEAGDLIVVAECDQFFTYDGAEGIRAAVAALEALPHVDSVLWMDQAPMMNLFGLPEPILPAGHASQPRFDSARERALAHPLVRGQLMSPDTKTLLLMVSIDWLFVTADTDCTDLLRDTATAAAKSASDGIEMRFRVTGNVPIRLGVAADTRDNEFKYQVISYSMALVIAFILFRGFSAVIIVALAPTAGVFWTLGVLHFLGFDGNPFNGVIVPVLLCMVGFTDGVHMMVEIRRHRAAGASPRDAARRAIREVGLACWLTSLTTAIGFGSLWLAHVEVVREFGLCCVIGVLITFVAVVTVIPWACSTPLGRRVHVGHQGNWIDSNLQRVGGLVDFVTRHSRLFSVLAVSLTLVMAVFTAQLKPDERLSSGLQASSEPVAALAHIDQHFGGMETAAVDFSWNENVASNDGRIATVAAEIDTVLRGEPLVGHPLSIVSLIDALPGEGDPATRMSLLDLLPPGLKRSYYVPEYHYGQVRFRIQDRGIATYSPVFERLQTQLALIDQRYPEFSVRLSENGAVWRWRNIYRVVVDLVFSLGSASVIIFAVLTLVYRSFRLGLISIVPNLFPLAATGTVLYFSGQNLEIVSVCAFTVCLGIAVDDTIHFMTRYREEFNRCKNVDQAIRNSFVGVGSALIMTTLVFVLGFSAALFSDARSHRVFATMGIMTIGSALFADLVFLPALLKRFTKESKLIGEDQTEAETQRGLETSDESPVAD